MADYKDFSINDTDTPKPWGSRETQAIKDIIDTLVGESVTVEKSTSGHRHYTLYTTANVLALSVGATDITITSDTIIDEAELHLDGGGSYVTKLYQDASNDFFIKVDSAGSGYVSLVHYDKSMDAVGALGIMGSPITGYKLTIADTAIANSGFNVNSELHLHGGGSYVAKLYQDASDDFFIKVESAGSGYASLIHYDKSINTNIGGLGLFRSAVDGYSTAINGPSIIDTSLTIGSGTEKLVVTSNESVSYATIELESSGNDNLFVISSYDMTFQTDGGTYGSHLKLDASNGYVGINESSPVTQIEVTTSAPYLTLHNNTHEDDNGSRESIIYARGEQSGGEETVLGFIRFCHDGASDDQKGRCEILMNDGDDGDTPSTYGMRMRADGSVFFGPRAAIVYDSDMTFGVFGDHDEVAQFASYDDTAYIRISDNNTNTVLLSKDNISQVGQTSSLDAANLSINASGYLGINETSPDGALHIGGTQGDIVIDETSATIGQPDDGTQLKIYLKADHLIFRVYNGATDKYFSLDTAGTAATWAYATSEPT